MIPAAFEYHRPATLREALSILHKHPGEARVLAGGQSLIPMMRLRLASPSHVVDLGGIADLSYVREADGEVAVGALTTYRSLETAATLRSRAPALVAALGTIADLQVRNRGTVGGALAHADPSQDLPALMVALEAKVHTAGGGRSRSIPAEKFFVDVYTTALREGEIITEVRFPAPPPRTGGAYEKLANKASHFAVVGVAAFVTLGAAGNCERVRIGITGAGSRAVRARAAERSLEGKPPTDANIAKAADLATQAVEAFTEDLHGSAAYREDMTRVMARRALGGAARRAGA